MNIGLWTLILKACLHVRIFAWGNQNRKLATGLSRALEEALWYGWTQDNGVVYILHSLSEDNCEMLRKQQISVQRTCQNWSQLRACCHPVWKPPDNLNISNSHTMGKSSWRWKCEEVLRNKWSTTKVLILAGYKHDSFVDTEKKWRKIVVYTNTWTDKFKRRHSFWGIPWWSRDLALSLPWAWVRSLVGELRSQEPHGVAEWINKRKHPFFDH